MYLLFFSLLTTTVQVAIASDTVTETTESNQQVEEIHGLIVDTSGTPIIGASVLQVGTTNGVTSDLDGKFTLRVPLGSTLKISYIGYTSVEVKAAKDMKITLREDTELLDEVVVVGYGTVKKSDVTGSVVSVNSKDMMKRNPLNLGEGLQGAAAGVSVVRNSGDPEGGVTIRIRGVATVNNSADPLYVVDGVQVGSSIEFINPNDVESIEILKDASATAIYGSKGANGVIMITTKKGSQGKHN
ncbi:MAG: TonB-dependent receptor plug domain-containing protein [Bacteroides sp.]|nr:TonB-dependent receptor plug domain-containing protein [Bacteroides sp.]